MLTELKLSNFRIFDDEVKIRFRPITVFIGRNSSGKSSIIKFLLMLKQSLTPGNAQFLAPDGEIVQLGAFPKLKDALSRKRTLRFELATSPFEYQMGHYVMVQLGLSESERDNALTYTTGATVQYSNRTTLGSVRFSVADQLQTKTLLQGGAQLLEGSTFLEWPFRNEDWDGIGEHVTASDDILGFVQLLVSQAQERKRTPLVRMMAIKELTDTLSYEIRSLRHLSPVRDESQRVIVASTPPIDQEVSTHCLICKGSPLKIRTATSSFFFTSPT